MHAVVPSALSAGSLVAGFAVAQATGVRALGGVVLVLGAAVCAVLWHRATGAARTALLLGVFAASFVVAHVLAPIIGAWPAVVVVAVDMAVVSLVLMVKGLPDSASR